MLFIVRSVYVPPRPGDRVISRGLKGKRIYWRRLGHFEESQSNHDVLITSTFKVNLCYVNHFDKDVQFIKSLKQIPRKGFSFKTCVGE